MYIFICSEGGGLVGRRVDIKRRVDMAIAVVVRESVKEGQLGAFVDYMAEMIKLTKQEEGCTAYDLYEAADGSGEVVMIEVWESKEALDKHMASEHFKKFVPGGEIYKTGPNDIKLFNRL